MARCKGLTSPIETIQITVAPRLHNNAFKGIKPLEEKISKSQNYSGFVMLKWSLLTASAFTVTRLCRSTFWGPLSKFLFNKGELLHLTTKWQDIEWWKLSFERLFIKIFCKNWYHELYLDFLLAIVSQIHMHIQLNPYLKPCSYWSKSSFQAYRFLKIPVHRDMGRAKLQKMRSLVSLWFRSLSVLHHWS